MAQENMRDVAMDACDDAFKTAIVQASTILRTNLVDPKESVETATAKARAALNLAVQSRQILISLCDEICNS